MLLSFIGATAVLTLKASVVLAGSLPAAINANRCPRQYLRSEFREMSRADWDAFRTALLRLQDLPSPDGRPGRTEWDYWTSMHIDFMNKVHGNARFFPWHRAYVLALERRLRSFGAPNSNIVIPYWDWTLDYARPLESPIFSPAYGLDVRANIREGDCRYRRSLFSNHCLRRQYNPGNFSTYYSPQTVAAVVANQTEYDSFRELIELVPHAIVHISLGGDMSTMAAPNDPIFWLHHSMVDAIWWLWQQTHPAHAFDYTGNVDTVLRPFNVTVRQVLDTENVCYSYRPFSRNPILFR